MENNETYFRLILEDIFDESQESKSIDAAKKYLINLGYSAEKADKYVRETVRELFPTLRSKKGGKFILGMTRISLEMSEMLNNSNIIELNNVLKLVVDGHYEEYDRNLNNLSPQQLIKRFALSQKENDTLIKTELKNMSLSDNGYSIIQINSFEDAQKYSQYTDWCITNNETMYNTYTSNGANQFYFCLKDGFENFKKEKGENCPLDEYGLSMIAVAVDPDGSMYTCTSRWNHDCGGDDSVMGVKQLSQVIGQSFYDVFKPNNVFNEIIAKVSDKLKNGEDPNNIFDVVGDFYEGFATVVLGDKCNWISENNEILSPNQWFDTTDPFLNGVAAVGLKHKWNFMRKNGYLLSPSSWFDDIESIFNRYGVATVIINGKPWLLKTNMLKIPKTCEIDNFSNINNFGLCMAARSNRNGKREFNFVNTKGEPICKEWFLSADGFTNDGVAMIESERGFNFINTNGQYISPNLWFEDAFPFDEGLGEVSHQDRWWNIDKNGKLIENNSLNESVKTDLSKARKSVDKNPSEKQKESGNYKKGHITINGFKITIENPKGSYRCGTDSNGKKWKIKMNNDYGYFLKTEGYDGDHVDVFLGHDFNSKKIFVVDQFINGKFDESKVMLGFNDIDVAKQNYLKNYEKDWKGFKEISEVSEELFKKWLYDGKKQRKPFYDYNVVKNVKKMKIKESVLRGLIQESIKKVTIKEGRESTKLTNRLIDMLYKVAQKYKSKYHDDDWSNVHAMLDEMRQIKGIADFFVADGRYRKHGEEFGEMTKVYKVNILTDFNTVINGTVNCHLCGTIDNPWSAYDISVSFYRMNENAEILESISKTLKENVNEVYTMQDWNRDGSLKLTVGQYIDDEVYEELLNSVPPTTHKSTLFQPGEAYDMSEDYIELYMTFINDGQWKYVGLCPQGSTKQLPRIDYSQFNESVTINESKRGLNSSKLYQIAKEHQGLRPRHGYSFKRFNELTDEDVIGVVDETELNRYRDSSWKVRQEWAMSKGFNVNKGDDVTFIPMNDWTWVAVIVRGDLLPDKEWGETSYGKKRIERNKNKTQNGTKNYVWSDSNTDKEKGLLGWSKRANEFARMKFNNDVRNSEK